MGERMGLLGKKLGMTQIFTEDGQRIPVTVVKTGPCVVLQVKTQETDGYSAIQLGFEDQKKHRVNRPDLVRFSKAETEPKRFVRELRLPAQKIGDFGRGQTINISDVFEKGDWIDVTGTSKGKGFQGVMKKYNFSGFRATHGTHEYFRHGGSIGCTLTPGRVMKGKKMPGQMGNERVTVQNLKIAEINEENGLVLVRGAIPGHRGNYVIIQKAVKKSGPKDGAKAG